MCEVFVCEIRVGQPSAKIVDPSVEELKYFKTSYGGFGPSWVFGQVNSCGVIEILDWVVETQDLASLQG